jgi:predicted SPOUT superfamily RNA methylase MTH1
MLLSSESNARKLSLAVPASLVSDTPHLREKTGKLGSVARACSIFGVTEIVLYKDNARREQKGDLELCVEILRFVETPQYLRKRMFRLTPNLRFAGILPPLQTPAHDVPHSTREVKPGDLRDGVIVERSRGTVLVDVGLEKALRCHGDFPVGKRVTVRLTSLGGSSNAEVLEDLTAQSAYWGYKVVRADSGLGEILDKGNFDLAIGTSRYGSPIADVWRGLVGALKDARQILIAFGSPRMGLRDILGQEKMAPEDVFDYFVNTVPDQNVSTVRTEEAILISLGILKFATSIY